MNIARLSLDDRAGGQDWPLTLFPIEHYRKGTKKLGRGAYGTVRVYVLLYLIINFIDLTLAIRILYKGMKSSHLDLTIQAWIIYP